MSKDSQSHTYDPAAVKAGDCLTLRYGNGTQLAYVREVTPSRLKGKPATLAIYRLYGRGWRGSPGAWTRAAPIRANDPRILSPTTPPPGTPPLPE
jgi:hypothetical protein